MRRFWIVAAVIAVGVFGVRVYNAQQDQLPDHWNTETRDLAWEKLNEDASSEETAILEDLGRACILDTIESEYPNPRDLDALDKDSPEIDNLAQLTVEECS